MRAKEFKFFWLCTLQTEASENKSGLTPTWLSVPIASPSIVPTSNNAVWSAARHTSGSHRRSEVNSCRVSKIKGDDTKCLENYPLF